MTERTRRSVLALALTAGLAGARRPAAAQDGRPAEILNVSYDVGRELFAELNRAFVVAWQQRSGEPIVVKQSHAASSRQARSILDGLQADIATFNQVLDMQILADHGFVAADWQARLPHRASPYYSLPAFLVRKGNPRAVRDWDDLVRADVKSVLPNPRTSGNARYTYLAAFAHALEKNAGDEPKAMELVAALLANVPVLDTGGRGATATFVEREIGDVLITFEAEAHGIRRGYGAGGFEVVLPSVSLLAEFPVAVVDTVVDRRGTRAAATAYLEFLYSADGQGIIARNFNRVRDPGVAAHYAAQFPSVRLVTVEDVFGGWPQADAAHFAEGGTLDRVLARR